MDCAVGFDCDGAVIDGVVMVVVDETIATERNAWNSFIESRGWRWPILCQFLDFNWDGDEFGDFGAANGSCKTCPQKKKEVVVRI